MNQPRFGMRTSQATLVAIGLTVLLVLAAPAARAADVKVTTTTANGTTEFKVVVSGLADGEQWKDLHFETPRHEKFQNPQGVPKGGNNVDVGVAGNTQEWGVSTTSSSTGIRVHTKSPNDQGFGNGTYTFKLTWPQGAGNPAACTWKATKNGGKTFRPGHVIDKGVTKDDVVDIPLALAQINDGLDLVLDPIPGELNTFTATAPGMGGLEYEIYASRSVNLAHTDDLGIGINVLRDPLFSGMGVELFDMVGVLDPDGNAIPEPSLIVFDPTLFGSSFYLVFAVKDGGEILYTSEPFTVAVEEPLP